MSFSCFFLFFLVLSSSFLLVTTAHLHVKFAALVCHGKSTLLNEGDATKDIAQFNPGNVVVEKKTKDNNKQKENVTRFLSLDKAIPGKSFLQVLQFQNDDENEEDPKKTSEQVERVENNESEGIQEDDKTDNSTQQEMSSIDSSVVLRYDEEWLAILRATHHLWNTSNQFNENTANEMKIQIKQERIWLNEQTKDIFVPPIFTPSDNDGNNKQMDEFLQKLGKGHVVTTPCGGGVAVNNGRMATQSIASRSSVSSVSSTSSVGGSGSRSGSVIPGPGMDWHCSGCGWRNKGMNGVCGGGSASHGCGIAFQAKVGSGMSGGGFSNTRMPSMVPPQMMPGMVPPQMMMIPSQVQLQQVPQVVQASQLVGIMDDPDEIEL